MGRRFESQSFFWTIIAIIVGLFWLIRSEYSYILLIALVVFLLYKFSVLVRPPEEPEYKQNFTAQTNAKQIEIKKETKEVISNPIYSESSIYFSSPKEVDDFLNYKGYIYGSELVISGYDINQERIRAIIKKHRPVTFRFINCDLTTIKYFQEIGVFSTFEFKDCNIFTLNKDLQELLENKNVFGLFIEQSTSVDNLNLLTNYENLTSLKLKLSLKEFPNFVTNMQQLESLDLSENMISKIPTEIELLSNLENLTLNDNVITEIPAEITNINKLKSLIIDGNKIKELPKEMVNLDLDWLYIDYDDLSSFTKETLKKYFESIENFG